MSRGSATECRTEDDGVRTIHGVTRPPLDLIGATGSTQVRVNGRGNRVRLAKFRDIVKDYQPDSRTDSKPSAAKIGCSLNRVETYSNRDSNIAAAVHKRFVEKFIPFRMLPNDRNKISKCVRTIIRVFFPRDEVQKWLLDHPFLHALKSTTMDDVRFEKALDDILDECGVMPDFKALVKREIMPEGKKPRMIINAGDFHQVSALLVISCFEHFWYGDDCHDHIKHADKKSAMERVVEHIAEICCSDPEAAEGDGSSWDFCQSDHIRNLIENPILQHIFECLYSSCGYNEVDVKTAQASLDFRRLPWWTVKMSTLDNKKGFRHTLKMRAVRPSGERGTSCLNHLVNCIMWACCLLDHPCELFSCRQRHSGLSRTYVVSKSLMSDTRQWATDVMNPDGSLAHYATEKFSSEVLARRRSDRRMFKRTGYKGAFEGDDSIVAASRWVWEAYEIDIRAYWHRAGFDMKIFRESAVKDGAYIGAVTFTGYDFLCNRGLPTKVMFPTIPRNVMNSAFTVSGMACDECSGKKSRHIRAAEVGVQSMSARASAFHPHLPYLANYFEAQAEYWQEYLASFGVDQVTDIVVDNWKIAAKFNVNRCDEDGSPTLIPIDPLLDRAKALYDARYEHYYDELVHRTLGYSITPEDKRYMMMLTTLDPDDEHIARSCIPPPFYGMSVNSAVDWIRTHFPSPSLL